MTLTLYHCPDWASQIIRLALEELALPYEVHPMDWEAGDFDAPGFRAVNPLGLIPALETPEGPMFETAAILLWLNARHGGLGPQLHEAEATAYLSWLLFVANTLHPTVMTMIHPDRTAGETAAGEAGRLALERVMTQAAFLETLITTRQPVWLTPEQPALGHYLGMLFRWAICLPEDPDLRFSLAPFPALTAVLAAHEATPAARSLAAADGLGAHPYTAPEAA
ncbi:glutathione S-transferase family protein [Tabrizicola sp.]|uniref:glutathione S-transferase family protein n=1 Tax=Tabrizicola sp. TaxID=2005166 RepID=UPI0025EFE054|nr:glutathione S-transferase family protein [Tabrizicola sp.]